MKHAGVWILVLLAAASTAAAQDAATGKDAAPPKVKIVDVAELDAPADGKIVVDEAYQMHLFDGRRAGAFYLVVAIKRLNPAKDPTNVLDLNIGLNFPGYQPVAAYAVAVEKKYLEEGKDSVYAGRKYPTWVDEKYYFGVGKGQRSWKVTVSGAEVGTVSDFFTTIVIQGLDGVSTRIKLPDGNYQVLNGNQKNKIVVPAGEYDLVLEARGQGKINLPWKKYDKGDIHYIAYAKDPRNVPVLPVERLKGALPKIYFGYKKYAKQTGTGGGAYNIGSADNPVHVSVYFGKDGTPGPLWKCASDRVEVEFDTTADTKKSRRRSKYPPAIRYTEQHNRYWAVQPWKEAEYVTIEKDASEVVGEAVFNQLRVRSTDSKPSRYNKDGLLEKGFLFDEEYGYFDVKCTKQGELYIVEGAGSKGP